MISYLRVSEKSCYYIAQINKDQGVRFTVTFDENAQKHRLFRSPAI